MEMAFMQEGGLKDEGGTVDPVSGNDVPSGSMQEEVRDDVPAMLSEGEFVFPADVVRYIGLSKLMQMRQQAKMGLKIMEKMGQMGNSEEATLPDDFGIPDIEIIEDDEDDEKEMAQGGVIHAQQGTDVPPQQTDFERMMGYGAGQGSNPYGPRRVPYKKEDGTIVNVLEDYMGRPMENIKGLTRVNPYQAGPIFGGDTPAGSGSVDPVVPLTPSTPGKGESAIDARREEKRKERRREERAILRQQQAKDAMQTSAERVFPNLTPEEAYNKYEKLTLGQRIKLIPQEIKVITGSDVSSEVVEDIINNPNKTKGKGGVIELVGNFVTDLVSGIFKPFGIDINKTPDIKTVVEEEGNAINASGVSNNDIKFDEDPTSDVDMFNAQVTGTVPYTDSIQREALKTQPATVQPVTPYSDPMLNEGGRGAITKPTVTPTTLNTNPLTSYSDPMLNKVGRGARTSKETLDGLKEAFRFLEKEASNLRNQNLNRTSNVVNKKRDDKARQRRRDKKRSFATAADKKTTKIIAKRGRRDQDRVDKEEKKIKDRLKEAAETGTLRLKKGGLMKKNYP